MKIHILFKIMDEPTGGGNKFLKALKRYLQSIQRYEDDIQKANVILFNSHHSIETMAKIKLKYPDKIFVHRIDGPMRLYNTRNDRRDDIVFAANKYLADATIFQSSWSRQQNHRQRLPQNLSETVIPNAPDPSIFNRYDKTEFSASRKIKLIATSWSANWNKGFATYQWLDENLDFDKYEMLFIGNSPISFKNIKYMPPVTTKEIARKLKENDIFIFASPIEACSNSLLEAMHCGLPAIAASGSSNPELIGKGGEIFSRPEEIPALLEKIIKNYHQHQANIAVPSIEEVGEQYYYFMTEVYNKVQSGRQKNKSFGLMDFITVQTQLCYLKLCGFIGRLLIKQP